MTTNAVVNLIETLYKARHEIAEAYDAGEIEVNEANRNNIEPLIKLLLVSRTSEKQVRLLTDLSRLINTALKKQVVLAKNSDLGIEIEGLDIEMIQLEEAINAQDDHTAERLYLEIKNRLYAIYDLLNITTIQLQAKVDSDFGTSKHSSARKAENEHCLRSIKRLIDSFNETRSSFKREMYQNNPTVSGYIHNIESKCLVIADRLLAIQDVIREHIFKQRMLEERARKIRRLTRFMSDRAGWYPGIAEKSASDHAYFSRIDPIKVATLPDIHNTADTADLTEMILSIQKRVSSERVTVQRDPSGKVAPPSPAREVQVSTLNRQANTLLKKTYAGVDKQSACEYYQVHFAETDKEDASQAFWLHYLLNFFRKNKEVKSRRISDLMHIELVVNQNGEFSGNYSLNDILISRKAR